MAWQHLTEPFRLMETAIDAGNMHALVEAMRTERGAWREEAEMLRAQSARRA